jgi:multicomponent Na+:H+ antiporter subunit E
MRFRASLVGQFAVLAAFWALLSDQWRPLHLSIGAVVAAVVTALTNRILATVLEEPSTRFLGWLLRLYWFVVFVGWLLGRIVVASTQIAYFALHPGRPFQPRFVLFHTGLERSMSRVVLAVSITMVPGTITVRLEGDEYLVHTLIPGSADDLASGRMQTMVARFMAERPEPAPEMYWGPLIEEAVR